MTMASAIMMVAAANASEVTTVSFSEARVNIPARVRFVQGDNYGFSVAAKDSILAKSVRCSVKDGVLRMNFGNSLKPGEAKYDAKKDVYYYGVNSSNLVFNDEDAPNEIVITVVAPEIPKFKTSSDFVTVSVDEMEKAGEGRSALAMSE